MQLRSLWLLSLTLEKVTQRYLQVLAFKPNGRAMLAPTD